MFQASDKSDFSHGESDKMSAAGWCVCAMKSSGGISEGDICMTQKKVLDFRLEVDLLCKCCLVSIVLAAVWSRSLSQYLTYSVWFYTDGLQTCESMYTAWINKYHSVVNYLFFIVWVVRRCVWVTEDSQWYQCVFFLCTILSEVQH